MVTKIRYKEYYIDAAEKTPELRADSDHMSVGVVALTEKGTEVYAYYDSDCMSKCWRKESTGRKISNIIGWREGNEQQVGRELF